MKLNLLLLIVLAASSRLFSSYLVAKNTTTVTTLYSFTGTSTDGNNPRAGLVQGTDGNFYGTTSRGGNNGLGVVFKVTVAFWEG